MKNIGTLPGERLAGLSADLFHKVQKGKITLDELDRFLKRENPFEATSQEDLIYGFYLWVDYGQSLEEMIVAGNYDWKNDDITACCWVCEMVDRNRPAPSDVIRNRMAHASSSRKLPRSGT